jgi:hypothetical protein
MAMKTIDPDIAAALKKVFEVRRLHHVGKIRQKQQQQALDKLETKIQLIADEVEEVLPTNHPAFEMVLALTVMEKLTKEPEFKSELDHFPPGW